MSRCAVIVAAGRGERMGLPEKVLLPIAGMPAIGYSLFAADRSTAEQIVLVAGAHCRSDIVAIVERLDCSTPVSIVDGGARRQDSVLAGIRCAQSLGATLVAVHDAARPLAPAELFDRTLDAALEYGAAIAAVPVVDTLKRVREGLIVETVPRDELWAAQTPQAFTLERLLAAFAEAERRDLTVTDEASLFEALDWPVAIVPGDAANMKLTYPTDVPLLEALLRARQATTTGPAL